MKKLVSLMVSFMMLINPIAGVLAEGESTQAPETQTVTVTAFEGEAAEKTVEAIEVTGSGDQLGAVVSGDAAPATLTVENDIKTTSENGTAGAANVIAEENQGSADLSAGQVTAETKGEGGVAVGVSLKSNGEESKAAANVSDVSAVSTDGVAIAVSAQAYEEKNTAEATTGEVSAEGKDAAAGIYAVAGADDSSPSDTAGSGNTVAVNTGNVTATSEEGASAIIAEANGSQNETTVKAEDVTAKGSSSAAAVTASANNEGESTGGNKTTVTTDNIAAVSAEGNATAIDAAAYGEKNTVAVTAAGSVSAEGKGDTAGITANAVPGFDPSNSDTGNTITISAGDVTASSKENSATGIEANTNGDQNEVTVKAENIKSEGEKTGIGIDASSGMYNDDSAGNKTTVTAKNVDVTSAESDAYGVLLSAVGDNNTTEGTTGDISAAGKTTARGLSVTSSADGSNSSEEQKSSETKASAEVGNVKASATNEATEGADHVTGTVTGIKGSASSEGSTVSIIAGNVTAEGSASGARDSRTYATGVDADNYQGGKQTITTGDIEVTAISKSEFNEQLKSENATAMAKGVDADAIGKGSDLTITTGSVTAEATAEGGIMITSDRTRYLASAEGSAVDLAANDSGSISYTADGDVVLTLTRTMEERTAESTAESTPVSPSSSNNEVEAGTYTGTPNAGLKISVVGKDSEVSAIINGNVNADSTTNRPDTDEPLTGTNVSGVIIGNEDIGRGRQSWKIYDENGNIVEDRKEDGSVVSYVNGKKIGEYNAQTGIQISYRENGTKSYENDAYGNTVYYDENGNETSRTGDLKERTPEQMGTANVKIEGDITSNGAGLTVVPTRSGGNINVIVEGTIKGESGAVVVNDNVNAGNFNLTVWKIEPAAYYEYDENGEVINEEEHYLETVVPEDEGYKIDPAASEEVLKQVQYIIKVDPNLSNAHVDLDGTTKFTDFTGEEYDVAHEDDKVVIKISADSGYQITGAFNGEGKEETLLRDSEGNYYIVVPRGGGVYLTATVEAINQGSPEEERGEKTAPTRLRANDKENDGGLAALDKTESNNRVAIPAVNRLIKSEERKMLAALSPSQQLLVVLIKAGFGDAASASGFTLSEEAKKLLDSLDVNLRDAVRIIYSYENGVKVKWYYLEMNLPGNKIGRFGFRQLEDGSWTVKML